MSDGIERDGKLRTVISSAEIAVLFFPVHLLQSLAALAANDELTLTIPMFLIPALSGTLCAAAAYSRKVTTVLIKIALSFPFTVLFRYMQANGDLIRRAVNWVYPSYGRLSAGVNFAGFVELLFLAAAILIGFIAAIATTASDQSGKFGRLLETAQTRVVPAVCIAVVVAVLVLNSVMPIYIPEIG